MKKVVTLNSGLKMPTVGLGTWLNMNVKQMADEGLDIGYRYIDTGRVYMNEKVIGEVLQSKISQQVLKREDVFISSKMWNNPNLKVESQVKTSLRELKVDYLDQMLIHWPLGIKAKEDHLVKQIPLHVFWAELESCVEKGLIRSIGVSNFNCQLMLDLLSYCKIRPDVNQIELHPYNNQDDYIQFLKRMKIVPIASSPLGRAGDKALKVKCLGHVLDIFKEPLLQELSDKYNRSVAQVALNWNIQRGCLVIPKTENVDRLRENLEANEFVIDEEDVQKINQLNQNLRTVDPKNEKSVYLLGYPTFD